MLPLNLALSLSAVSARLALPFEMSGQVLAEQWEVISKLLPRRVSGKRQLRLLTTVLVPLLNYPFGTIGEKTAKLRQ